MGDLLKGAVGVHTASSGCLKSKQGYKAATAARGLPFPGFTVIPLIDGLIPSCFKVLRPQAPAKASAGRCTGGGGGGGSGDSRWHCLLHFRLTAWRWVRGSVCMRAPRIFQGWRGSPQICVLFLGPLLLRIKVVPHHLL